MKTCKQCNTCKDESNFRGYVPRGTGAYKTVVGVHTICIDCESINMYALRLEKLGTAKDNEKLVTYYNKLFEKGYFVPLVGRRVAGLPLKDENGKKVTGVTASKTKIDNALDNALDMLAGSPKHGNSALHSLGDKLESVDNVHLMSTSEEDEVYVSLQNYLDEDWEVAYAGLDSDGRMDKLVDLEDALHEIVEEVLTRKQDSEGMWVYEAPGWCCDLYSQCKDKLDRWAAGTC